MLHEFIKKIALEYGTISIDYNDKVGFIASCDLTPNDTIKKTGWSLSYTLGLLETELSYNTK